MNIFKKLLLRFLYAVRKPQPQRLIMNELPLEKELYLAAYQANFKYMTKEEVEDNFMRLLKLYMVKEELLKQLLKDKVSGELSIAKDVKWFDGD
jgi:hypothetical protein